MMKKIPTLFRRDPDNPRRVLREITPGCEWVMAGEGLATRKYDGTCVMYDGRDWWARREVRPGKQPPGRWVEVQADETTGKRVGWEPFTLSPFAKPLNEAQFRDVADGRVFREGTYELVGPKVNGNPEKALRHMLISHADEAERYPALDNPQGYDELRRALEVLPWEGIVWHHPDGRMAKLKGRDFR